MIYLGLHNSYQSGAALIIDDKIIGAVSEERFNRVKNCGGIPNKSINYLLNEAKIKLSDVDKIIYGICTPGNPSNKIINKIKIKVSNLDNNHLEKIYERMQSEIDWNKKYLDELDKWIQKNNLKNKIVYVDHHLSHAAGAYLTSPFDESLIFTCDGKGNFKSSTIMKAKKNIINEIDFNTTYDSLGYFYGNITKSLGYEAEKHEGKITGLAAFGNEEKFLKLLKEKIFTKSDKIDLNFGNYYLPWFCEKNELPLLYKEVEKYKKEDVAAASQKILEDTVCTWINNAIKKYKGKKTNICLSGGVFANVKLNQKIKELKTVKNIFVQPAMGDMGIPLGSCLYQYSKDKNRSFGFLNTMSLGPKYSNDNIKIILNKYNLKYKYSENLEIDFLKYISENKVIGFFNGRMEYGPRALCNRTIFYHCRDKNVNNWLNKRLNRSDFMPFAPVTTKENAKKCFIGWQENQKCADFMTLTYKVTQSFKKKCPAAVHIDGTARPQILNSDANYKVYKILKYYFKKTNELALINTSFNNHEEPIVCSPENAIESLFRNNIDVLFMENYIIAKN